jgi:hypothetical protein
VLIADLFCLFSCSEERRYYFSVSAWVWVATPWCGSLMPGGGVAVLVVGPSNPKWHPHEGFRGVPGITGGSNRHYRRHWLDQRCSRIVDFWRQKWRT